MNKKQKNVVLRLAVSAAMFAALLIAQSVCLLCALPGYAVFILYLIPYLIIGYDVILSAFKNIIRGNVFDEHFLMTVATFAAFALGLFGDGEYPEALAVMLFYQLGELIQGLAVGKSRASITEMMELAPEYANLEKDGAVTETDPEEVHAGDIILVKPGEKIPLDGVVLEGESHISTAALTGESVPRTLRPGDEAVSGCVNGGSPLRIKVTKEYEDSTVSKVLELVENASTRKARLENFITRFARYYTPIVTVCAVLLAAGLPLIAKLPWTEGVRRACGFLIVSCPCALVISVPVGFFGGIGAASRIGVLVKGSNYLEAASSIGVMVMDKTGTLTKGEFKVSHIHPENGYDEQSLLELAAHGEGFSDHPIARSVREAYGKDIDLSEVSEVSEISGQGVSAVYKDKPLLLGNTCLMRVNGISCAECRKCATVVYAAHGDKFAGHIAISDTIKDGAKEAIQKLKKLGIRKVVMLTGDRRETAESIAKELSVDEVRSELLPDGKVDEVERLMSGLKKGEKLGFVGDGINDAPVLMRADVGFAMGSLGSDAAIEAADIVIMDDDIGKLPEVISIARKTMRIVRANVIFSLAVKLVILLLSAVGIASMWAAVFGDVGVTVLCVLNSMRALIPERK